MNTINSHFFPASITASV